MTNFLDMFIPLQKQLHDIMGWSTSDARTFVNNIINNYIIDLRGQIFDITANDFDSSTVVLNPSKIKSQLLYSQLNNLSDPTVQANDNWTIRLPLDSGQNLTTETGTITGQRIIQIAIPTLPYEDYHLISKGQNSWGPENKSFTDLAAIFVGKLAHEVGHAQDYQLNTMNYVGDPTKENGLSVGARLAEKLITEGKALFNNIKIAFELKNAPTGALDIPVTASALAIQDELANQSSASAAVLAGAQGFASLQPSGTNDSYINSIWSEALAIFQNSNPTLANKNVLDALYQLDMHNVRQAEMVNNVQTYGVTFTPHADTTITMTINFQDGSSYVNRFGGYGAITAGDTGYGNVAIVGASPSPAGMETYQKFTYADGSYLLDEYNVTIDGVSYGEVVSRLRNNGEVEYRQYNQVDANGHITSAYFVGSGAVAEDRLIAANDNKCNIQQAA